MDDGQKGTGGDSEWRDQCRRWTGERSIATGLGRKPVGYCYSVEMRSGAPRTILPYPILPISPAYQPPIQDVSLQISVTNCVPLRGYTMSVGKVCRHDDVIKWEHLCVTGPFMRRIYRWPVDSPNKGQWRGALMFSLICAWTNGWASNRDAGDLRCHRAHYDVTVMDPHIIFSRKMSLSAFIFLITDLPPVRCRRRWLVRQGNERHEYISVRHNQQARAFSQSARSVPVLCTFRHSTTGN